MNFNRVSGLRSRLNLRLARWLVDADYYLDRYPDVRAAGIDPFQHFAECGCAVPMRAANPSMERLIFRVSPLLALLLVFLPIRRDDWLQCFVARHQDLWCGDLGLEFRFSRCVAKLLAWRAAGRNWPSGENYNKIIGTTLPVVRIGDDLSWLTTKLMDPTESYQFSSPRIWGAVRTPDKHRVMLPPLWSAIVHNASVFGAMQIVANGNYVVYEPAADPRLSFFAGQYRHVITCFPTSANKIMARIPDHANDRIKEAILLGGRCSNNHFHFLIEYLTKGYILEQLTLPDDIALIVSDDIFPAQMEAVKLLFPNRSVVQMSNRHRLDVEKLHVPAVMTYLPDALEIKDWKKDGVRRASLNWMRKTAYQKLGINIRDAISEKRIYLKRKRGRNIINADEVESIFLENGFISIDPSDLSFSQQVQLFADATHVAGPLGAAFSNTVFCRPGTLILGIGGRHGVKSSIFQNIAEAGGCTCINFVSDKTPRDYLRIRSNAISLRQGSYTINVARLKPFVAKWLH